MPQTPLRPRPVARVPAAFDDLKRAEEEAVRLARNGHVFATDNAVVSARSHRD